MTVQVPGREIPVRAFEADVMNALQERIHELIVNDPLVDNILEEAAGNTYTQDELGEMSNFGPVSHYNLAVALHAVAQAHVRMAMGIDD